MLDETLKFLRLLRDLEDVQRTIYRPNGQQENDVEHSWQVAMMAWFWAHQFNLTLSREKLLTYGLVHDLIEVYASDTPVYNNATGVATKERREREALQKIKAEHGDFSELINAIEQYEAKADDESVFIYETDKLLPALNLYLDNGYGWNRLGLTLVEIKKEKRSKIQNVPELIALLEEALARFEKEQKRLFDRQ